MNSVQLGTSNIVKGVSSDITNIKFYKSPVFYTCIIYISILSLMYINMENSTKNNYIFSNKFRDDQGNVSWIDIFIYPYGVSTVPNIIKSLFTGPILLYLLLFTTFFTSAMNINSGNVQPFFYAVMISYFVLFVIFMIHVFMVNYVIGSKNVNIPSNMKKDKNVTYGSLYRTQWILLLFISPLYAFTILYITRKLS
tara:strand:- start:143 stop:730 length:588 start_codon:yes stop_codon:yes gene_type:complete